MSDVQIIRNCEDCPLLHLLIQGDGHICKHPTFPEGMIIDLSHHVPPPPDCPLRKKDLRVYIDKRLKNP